MARINKKVDSAIVDSILREAAIEAFTQELSELSSDHTELDTNYSTNRTFIRNINNRYKHLSSSHSSIYYCFKNTAAAFLILSTVGFVILLSMPSVRAEALDTVENIFDKYVSFDFSDGKSSELILGSVTLKWIPKAYVLTDSFTSDSFSSYTLTDNAGNEINLSYGLSNLYTPQIDSETLTQKTIYVNDILIYLFSENDSEHNLVVWNNDNMTFLIDSVLPENDIVNIIKNIR